MKPQLQFAAGAGGTRSIYRKSHSFNSYLNDVTWGHSILGLNAEWSTWINRADGVWFDWKELEDEEWS